MLNFSKILAISLIVFGLLTGLHDLSEEFNRFTTIRNYEPADLMVRYLPEAVERIAFSLTILFLIPAIGFYMIGKKLTFLKWPLIALVAINVISLIWGFIQKIRYTHNTNGELDLSNFSSSVLTVLLIIAGVHFLYKRKDTLDV